MRGEILKPGHEHLLCGGEANGFAVIEPCLLAYLEGAVEFSIEHQIDRQRRLFGLG